MLICAPVALNLMYCGPAMIKSSAVIEAVTLLDMEVVNEVYQFMEETHYFCACAVQLDGR